MPCLCDDSTSSPFVAAVFNQCVATNLQYVSFIVGWLSIACWIVALYPYIRLNFLLKQTEAISLPFILQWIAGDICNAASTLILRLLLTQYFLGCFYCVVDVFLIAELIVYRKPNARFIVRPTRITPTEAFTYCALVAIVLSNLISYGVPAGGLMRVAPQNYSHCQSKEYNNKSLYIFGNVLSYLCIPLYGLSKPFYIYKNYRRKEVEGLSAAMFVFTLSGNIFYFISLMCDIAGGASAVKQAPFIFSCTWPAVCDCIILCQCYHYTKLAKKLAAEQEKHMRFESDQKLNETITIASNDA